MSNDQATKIADKAKWLREHLEEWQQAEGVLGIGQQLVFELRVETVPLVVQDTLHAAPYAAEVLPIAGFRVSSSEFAAGSGRQKETYDKAAVLNELEIKQVLSWFKEGTLAHKAVECILVEHRNNPFHDQARWIGSAHQTKINAILRGYELGERKLRLASRREKYQVWEVK